MFTPCSSAAGEEQEAVAAAWGSKYLPREVMLGEGGQWGQVQVRTSPLPCPSPFSPGTAQGHS